MVTLCLEVSLDAVKAAARQGRQRGATVLLNVSPHARVGADPLHLVDIRVVRAGAYAATGEGAHNSYPTSPRLAEWTP